MSLMDCYACQDKSDNKIKKYLQRNQWSESLWGQDPSDQVKLNYIQSSYQI